MYRGCFLIALLSITWLGVQAQTPTDVQALLNKTASWTRSEVPGIEAGINRVITISHPPKFTVIDETSAVMPIVIFSSQSNGSEKAPQSDVSAKVYENIIRNMQKSLQKLMSTAERTYAVSTENVVVAITDYEVQLLFNSTVFNNTIYSVFNRAVANCTKHNIAYEQCNIGVLPIKDLPLAVLKVSMKTNRIGRSNIIFMFRAENVTGTETAINDTQAATVEVIVVRPETLLDMIFRLIMTVFIIIITFGMGCELDLKVIWVILRRPFAPIIGFCSQFILMPLLSFGIGQLFLNTPDTKLFGFGLLVVGCCPGGGSSNMWTLMLGGHLDLSMTMTFFSSTFALGMMPLWLFLLAPYYVDLSQVVIPYGDIAKNLLMFTLPAAVGIVLRTFKPKWADKAANPVKYAAFFYLIFMITFGTWVNWYMYRTISYFPYLIPIAMMLPWCGMLFGYGVAFILRQGHRKALTIAIETGIQNVGIAMIILRYAFPPPDGQLAAVVVMIVILFTPIPLYFALIGRGIYRYWLRRKEEKMIPSSSNSSDDEEGVKLNEMDPEVVVSGKKGTKGTGDLPRLSEADEKDGSGSDSDDSKRKH